MPQSVVTVKLDDGINDGNGIGNIVIYNHAEVESSAYEECRLRAEKKADEKKTENANFAPETFVIRCLNDTFGYINSLNSNFEDPKHIVFLRLGERGVWQKVGVLDLSYSMEKKQSAA